MTSRVPKARIPASSSKEKIEFSKEQWQEIESKYGHNLPPEIRDHISLVTHALALVGGALGVLGGVIVGKLITLIVGFPTAVPIWAVFLGLFLATAVGIFFGVYPASKAAKLDPVVALRAEM